MKLTLTTLFTMIPAAAMAQTSYINPSTVSISPNSTSVNPLYTTGTFPIRTFTHTESHPVLDIHQDGTLTFYDKDGNKIADYDPGPKAREALKSGVDQSNCSYPTMNYTTGNLNDYMNRNGYNAYVEPLNHE